MVKHDDSVFYRAETFEIFSKSGFIYSRSKAADKDFFGTLARSNSLLVFANWGFFFGKSAFRFYFSTIDSVLLSNHFVSNHRVGKNYKAEPTRATRVTVIGYKSFL